MKKKPIINMTDNDMIMWKKEKAKENNKPN